MNKAYSVYKHITPSRKVYIGITSNKPERRWGRGCNYKNSHFANAIKKYGWDAIEHLIIATDLTKEEACALEIELIKKYDATNPRCGYNILRGGNMRNHTEETRRKMSETRRGKHFSEEWKQHLSEAQKGVPVLAHTTEGEYLAEYRSIRAAAVATGLSEGTIRDCCNARISNAKGVVYSYKDEERRKVYIDKLRRSVVCVETGNVYRSIKEAAIATGATVSCISDVLRGKKKRAGGYTWRTFEVDRTTVTDTKEEAEKLLDKQDENQNNEE